MMTALLLIRFLGLNFMQFITSIAVLLIPSLLLAGTPSDPPGGSEPASIIADGGHAHAGSISTSAAVASGGAGGEGGNAVAGATGGTGGEAQAEQSQTATSNASNAGNTQALTVNSRYEQRRQAPNVYAPAVYASGPCAYGWSAGAAIPGGGASFGRAKPDTNCDRRELARVLTPLNPHLALKLLCADPLIRELYADNPQAAEIECTYIAAPIITTSEGQEEKSRDGSSDTPDPRYATKDELRRAFEQAQQK